MAWKSMNDDFDLYLTYLKEQGIDPDIEKVENDGFMDYYDDETTSLNLYENMKSYTYDAGSPILNRCTFTDLIEFIDLVEYEFEYNDIVNTD